MATLKGHIAEEGDARALAAPVDAVRRCDGVATTRHAVRGGKYEGSTAFRVFRALAIVTPPLHVLIGATKVPRGERVTPARSTCISQIPRIAEPAWR